MGIYDNIKAICKEKGIPITKMEEDINYPQGAVQRWKKHEPGVYRLVDIAKYLGVTIDDLVFGKR